MSIIHIFFVQGLKTELEKVSPALGRTAVYTRESKINELPRQVHKTFTFLLVLACPETFYKLFPFQVLDCAVRSFLLEKGIEPKGKDFTSMLAPYSLVLDF
jgi:hypothetical protein